jgi:hypothetical protein
MEYLLEKKNNFEFLDIYIYLQGISENNILYLQRISKNIY